MDSPYSISKLVGEFYAVYYHERHQLPTVRARFQNVYGPREILGAGQWRGTPATVWRNVTPTFVYKSLLGESLPLEGDGDPTRDFIYVDDLVEGLCEGGPLLQAAACARTHCQDPAHKPLALHGLRTPGDGHVACLLYTSDAADE